MTTSSASTARGIEQQGWTHQVVGPPGSGRHRQLTRPGVDEGLLPRALSEPVSCVLGPVKPCSSTRVAPVCAMEYGVHSETDLSWLSMESCLVIRCRRS